MIGADDDLGGGSLAQRLEPTRHRMVRDRGPFCPSGASAGLLLRAKRLRVPRSLGHTTTHQTRPLPLLKHPANHMKKMKWFLFSVLGQSRLDFQ